MKDIKIGIELYALMPEFNKDPEGTLAKIKEMGYTGVEFPMFMLRSKDDPTVRKPASLYRSMLEKAGLECYGLLVSWIDVQPDIIDSTIEYCKEIGSPFLIIGSVPRDLVSDLESANKAIDYMFEIQKKINAAGLPTGYHNHDSDFTNVIEGKTFFEHIFDRAPEDFIMLLDTGNAHAGGANSFELLRKYPHRSPFFHIKGYSQAEGYRAYVGRDDYDWKELLDLSVNTGDAKIFNIEFGTREDIDSYERAKFSLDAVLDVMKDM
ncbi:MAG: sugar phosphate isomerase/epimerase [Ruminococcaceae bacterium]|nr:sugar phosphate isomerase/epimerase [Oscillospiraceae bacterium]